MWSAAPFRRTFLLTVTDVTGRWLRHNTQVEDETVPCRRGL
jgi:hypothetical protein